MSEYRPRLSRSITTAAEAMVNGGEYDPRAVLSLATKVLMRCNQLGIGQFGVRTAVYEDAAIHRAHKDHVAGIITDEQFCDAVDTVIARVRVEQGL